MRVEAAMGAEGRAVDSNHSVGPSVCGGETKSAGGSCERLQCDAVVEVHQGEERQYQSQGQSKYFVRTEIPISDFLSRI